MAGTLTVSTLSDGTNSGSATDAIKGSARAWVNFNGNNTVSIRGSYNVSSITDISSGHYRLNMTNAMPDTNFCALGSAAESSGDPNRYVGLYDSFTTTSVTFRTQYPPGSPEDVALACLAIFR